MPKDLRPEPQPQIGGGSFKILAGQHVADGKVYHKGEVVESTVDLEKTQGANKYKRVSGTPATEPETPAEPSTETPVTEPSGMDSADTLDAMTVADLKELAADEEIDLGGAHLKADIIAAIQKSRK